MNITIFGGTGATGLLLIEKVLQSGHSLTVYARTPAKISIQNSKLKIVKGELTESEKIEEAIKNADAVISVLGPTGKSKGLTLSNGFKNIVHSMSKNNVKRLIATATPAFKDKNDKFQFGFAFAVFMVKTLLGDTYKDINELGKTISQSNLDWTIVRLPMLTNKPSQEKLKIGYPGDGKVKLFSLTRNDLADFLLQQVNDKNWLHKSPLISN